MNCTANKPNGSLLLKKRVVLSVMAVVIQLAKISWARSTTLSSTTSEAPSNQSDDCTPPAIEEFPDDFFTQEQRAKGGLVLHLAIATYLILALGIICEDYFVPALEVICERLHLSSDVAGATFMAAGTSTPELFTNVMGTFITKSDLGIGTIVGSAVFNIFGVVSVCGIFAGLKIPLDWYPVTRDCFFYSVSIVILFVVLIDEEVYWWEALIMIVAYVGYIVFMTINTRVEEWSLSALEKMKLQRRKSFKPNEDTKKTVPTISGALEPRQDSIDSSSSELKYPWQLPTEGFLNKLWCICFFPMNLLFFVTIPNVRRPKCINFFPLSFIMCMVWIGGISYEVTWLITVIGYTISVPDTVMGLSFLAIGTSVPEVFSSLIVSRQGKGSMAVSNSIGSNTFDMLVCLGVPWMIRALITGFHEDKWYVQVQSDALAFTVACLLLSMIVLYTILVITKFVITRTLGIICLVIYLAFITISLLFELNVFYYVNPPTCQLE